MARAETARAALRILEGQESVPSVDELRRQYETRIRLGEAQLPEGPIAGSGAGLSDLQRRAIAAQRQALVDLRARAVIGDDAFHAAEEEIDLLELAADERIRPQV